MKTTMYFSSTQEMNNYFPSGVPSNVLAIIQTNDENGAVLYTSSNNQVIGGPTEEQGGYIDSPAEKIEKAEALNLSEEILEGEKEN